MPKRNLIMVQLPPTQPDCCAECPLVGIIPKEQRRRHSKETHVCIATGHAITARGIHLRKSKKDSQGGRKFTRPCDDRWGAWMTLPYRKFGMSYAHYRMYRMPFDEGQQLKIIFHERPGRPTKQQDNGEEERD